MAIWDIKERYDLARSNSLESQATRGIFMGGFSTDESNIVDFITITSSGNAADFGDCIKQVKTQDAVHLLVLFISVVVGPLTVVLKWTQQIILQFLQQVTLLTLVIYQLQEEDTVVLVTQ